jgi:hypothetical protein
MLAKRTPKGGCACDRQGVITWSFRREFRVTSGRQPPQPLPIRKEPYDLVPTRSDEGRHRARHICGGLELFEKSGGFGGSKSFSVKRGTPLKPEPRGTRPGARRVYRFNS